MWLSSLAVVDQKCEMENILQCYCSSESETRCMGNLESITKKGHSSVMVKLSLHTKIVVYGRSYSQQTHDDMFNTVKHVAD